MRHAADRRLAQKLGLSEYADRFAENRIDFSVLRDLTDQDLKDIGVVLGDRRKILRAIGELAGASPATAQVHAVIEPKPQDSAERRQVTVMFSDLVGSTALSARMDPEDLREVISAYQKCVAETVQPFGGFVAKYMGDGVLIYFGYPQAHEDDAERAVRAGVGVGYCKSPKKRSETLAYVIYCAPLAVSVEPVIEPGIVGGEKYDAAPDLFRFAEAADRNRWQDTVLKNVFRHRLHHFGVDVTGSDRIDGDADAPAFLCQRLGEAG